MIDLIERKERTMNRLTMKSDKGGLAFTFDLYVTCKKEEMLKILKIGNALKEYEDLGLTPDQIREVDRLYAEKCKEVAELKKFPWIPVTERLPEELDLVLVCDRDGYVDIAWGWYVKDKWWWNKGDDVNYDNIIAWMPLPEPYTESVKK